MTSKSARALRHASAPARVLALLSVLLLPAGFAASPAAEPSSSGTNGPHALVVTVRDPDATEAFRPRQERIPAMVKCAITNLTGKASLAEAWRNAVFTNGVVSTTDVVGIKVYSVPGPNSGTRPAVVAAVVEGLLAAGVPPQRIVVWDKRVVDLRLAGFFELAAHYGIRVAGSADAGYDETAFYDSPLLGDLVWGDFEFGRKTTGVGRKSFVSKLVSREITRIINVTPLLNHNEAGVSGNLYSLAAGSVDNFARFESDTGRLANAVPEIYAMPYLSDKVVLSVVDALICQYEGGERGLLHYSAMLNELRFSKDPVALDVLSLNELVRQRRAAQAPAVTQNLDLYSNAALLELGVNDIKRIRLETLSFASATTVGTNASLFSPLTN
ncbi:MAG TPA: DUF362 domain-containing protein [Candidatus Binatia bacterium]|nr:DUF362 domain-containing protein [Candidatus Binatia bacterium]